MYLRGYALCLYVCFWWSHDPHLLDVLNFYLGDVCSRLFCEWGFMKKREMIIELARMVLTLNAEIVDMQRNSDYACPSALNDEQLETAKKIAWSFVQFSQEER